ncbi:RHS repeat-associated core domain-containing protein [Pseudomonas sp. NPDC090592]|uniref:RHS repeat-associated core domain-containing protein n=1 Tax=Pseudomonas sp. NPDC090592 TaxID=3364480 RepID=UPI00383AE589
MPSHKKQSIFYQAFSISTVIYNDKSTSIIRSESGPIAERTLNSTPNELALLSTDNLNTPISIVHNENISGKAFSAYGYISTECREHSLIGFAGETPIVGEKYLLGSYRIFDPVLMRFHSPDNLSPFLAGSINSYGYCSGDPINNTDPTGHVKNRLRSFRKLFSNKKNKPMNTSLSQSTPAVNQPSEYSQPESFNPTFEGKGEIFLPSKDNLKSAKSLSNIVGTSDAPTLEHLMQYEPSAPLPVNTLTDDNLKYLRELERLASSISRIMRERRPVSRSIFEHRRIQDFSAQRLDEHSNEITKMLFKAGYTPSPENVQRLIRRT